MSNFISLHELAQQIANSLFPLPTDEELFALQPFTEKICCVEGTAPTLEQITDEDLKELSKLWESLPQLPKYGHTSVDDSPSLEPYKVKINSKNWKHNWQPRFLFASSHTALKIDRVYCRNAHLAELKKRIHSENLIAYDHYSAPTSLEDEFEENLQIKRIDADTYCAEIGINLMLGMQTNIQPVRRILAATVNQNLVLGKIIELNYDPLELPREKKAGARSEAKSKVRVALPRMTKATFDKAWQALRNDGKIKDAA
jgi:hypothetical protein